MPAGAGAGSSSSKRRIREDDVDDEERMPNKNKKPKFWFYQDRQPKNPSKVWDTFTEITQPDGTKKARCSLCETQLPLTGSKASWTAKLRHHLGKGCSRIAATSVDDQQLSGPHNAQQLDLGLYDAQRNRELFVKMVIDTKIMLHHVENPFLKQFALSLQPHYRHLNHEAVTKEILTFYNNGKAMLKDTFSMLNSRVSLSFSWDETSSFVCVAAHFIDCDFKLVRRVLGFISTDCETSQLQKFTEDWEFSKWILALTTDGCLASTNLAVPGDPTLREILRGVNFIRVGDIVSLFCSMACDFFDRISLLTVPINEILRSLNESCELLDSFNRIAFHHHLSLKYEFNLSDTRGLGSTFNMLHDAFPYKEVLCALTDKQQFWDDAAVLAGFTNKQEFWSEVEKVLELLNPINDMVVMLSSCEFPTLNLLIKLVLEAKDVLLIGPWPDLDLTRDAMIESLKMLEVYLASCDAIVHFASLLDPQFKSTYLEHCNGNSMPNKDQILEQFEAYFNSYQSEIAETSTNPNCSEPVPEWKRYLESSSVNKDVENFDLLSWWKSSESEYPVLSKMARDILAVPASSSLTSGTESLQEIWREIFWSPIPREMSEVLVCCNNWLRSNPNSGAKVHRRGHSSTFDLKKCRELLANFVLSSKMPFNLLNNSKFIEWVRDLEPMYDLSNVVGIERDRFGFYQMEREILQNDFNRNVSRISLSIQKFEKEEEEEEDSEDDEDCPSYMCIRAHFIDNEFKLVQGIIGMKDTCGLTGQTIAAQLERSIQNWGIDKKVLAFTTNKGVDEILYWLKCWVGKTSLQCSLDGLFGELSEIALDPLQNEFLYIEEMIQFLRNRPDAMQYFNCLAFKYGIAPKSDFLSVRGSWKPIWGMQMLNDVLPYREVFDKFAEEDAFCSGVERLSRESWEQVEYSVAIWKPIYRAAIILSSSNYPTSNLCLRTIFEIHDVLSFFYTFEANKDQRRMLLLDKMLAHLVDFWKDCERTLLVASMLDPQLKFKYLERCYGKHITDEKEISTCIQDLINIYEDVSLQDAPERVMLELQAYKEEDCVEIKDEGNFDILRWWKDNQANYPILSKMARDILAIPVSSVPLELAFQAPTLYKRPTFAKSAYLLGEAIVESWGRCVLEILDNYNNWLSAETTNKEQISVIKPPAERTVDLNCINASKPYNECTDGSFKRISDRGRIDKDAVDESERGKHAPENAAIDSVSSSHRSPRPARDINSTRYLEHCLNQSMTDEIVVIEGIGLTANQMECLITRMDGTQKWVPDEVINCCIAITKMKNKSTTSNILILGTFDCQLLELWAPSMENTEKNHSERTWSTIIKRGNEFLDHDLVFFPFNISKHWFVGVLNTLKKEFQILNSLDSLGARRSYEKETSKLRSGIQVCINAAIESRGLKAQWRPNTHEWPVRAIESLPQQNDKNSCGLFAVKFMELWDGTKLACDFTQEDIDIFRRELVNELLLSEHNELKAVQDEIRSKYALE